MHIALAIQDLVGGGAERSVINLAGGLVRRGHAVDIVLSRRVIDYPIPEGVRVFVPCRERPPSSTTRDLRILPEANRFLTKSAAWFRATRALHGDLLCLPGPRSLQRALAIATYIRQETPDCILPNLREATFNSFLACGLLPRHPPLIPVVRSSVRYRGFRGKRRDRHMLTVASRFVAVSHGVADSLATNLRIPEDSISTIYNAVITSDLPARMAAIPAHPWLTDATVPLIVAAGRLADQKDYPTLLRAFARVTALRKCRLIILGEGKLRKDLERLGKELGIHDRVSLPGWVDNPFVFMARASLFVLSSKYEGLPGSLVQALACGSPCVSTDCPAGPREILQGGTLGPLVPVGDEVALADAMEQVLSHPPDREALRRRGADFSVEKAAASYEKLIAGVLAEKTTETAHEETGAL